jgi:membrane protease YdiL (CAAX protease family)
METTLSLKMKETGEIQSLQPMGWIESILVVLIPALGMIFAHYVAFPYLKSTGLPPYESYCLAVVPVMASMLLAALIGYRREGHSWTWSAFSQRFRLTRMSKRAWLWTGAAILAYLAIAQLVNILLIQLYSVINFTIPTTFVFAAPSPLLALVSLIFNIVGEEFWWRGYILPRQEARFGRRAWLVNGTLWAFFHTFRWWGLPGLLIFCQIIPFLSQRVKNNWPAIILHSLTNGLGIVLTVIMQLS